jgi:hypothetical protein
MSVKTITPKIAKPEFGKGAPNKPIEILDDLPLVPNSIHQTSRGPVLITKK